MARRILGALRRAVNDAPAHEPVHFHAGVSGDRPIVCHDAACASPRLHIGDT